jgi:hypothetical protein
MMEAFILPISFKPESGESIPSTHTAEGAGNFEKILRNRSSEAQDRAGETDKGSFDRRDWKRAGMVGSRKFHQKEGRGEEISDPLSAPQSRPEVEKSPGLLEMAKLLSGASEGGGMKGEEGPLPQECDSLHQGNLPPDADLGELPASQRMETGKGSTNQSSIAIPPSWILSQMAHGRGGLHSSATTLKEGEDPQPDPSQSTPGRSRSSLSAPLLIDEENSQAPQTSGEAAGSQQEELPAWIETMKSAGPGELNQLNKVRSQTPQGAAPVWKNLQAEGKEKTVFTGDFPEAKAAALEEVGGPLKLDRENPPFTGQNPEQEDRPLFEKIFGKSPDHPASSLQPGEQAFAGKEQKPIDSHGENPFPPAQMDGIPHEGASFHPESMGGGKPEMGEPKVLLGGMEGPAANLHGLGKTVEGGSEGLAPGAARAEILNVPEQVVQRIIWSIRNQEERIKLTLDPPDLGHLYIEISRSKDNIHATLWADNAAAKTALETGQHQIQRIMENEGFKLAKFDVFVQQDLGWFQGQGKRENPFAPDNRNPILSLESQGEVLEKSPIDPVEIRRKSVGRSGLDLWV